MSNYLFLFISSGILTSYLFLQFLLHFFSKKLLDNPNDRSLHSLPTPSGGGIAFVSTMLFASLIFGINISWNIIYILVVSLLPLALIGIIDDIYKLPALLRYIVQVFTSIQIINISQSFLVSYGLDLLLKTLIYLSLIFFITAIINLTNFMDGIDGLVASCFLIMLTSAFFMLSNIKPIFILVGSLIPFLYLNWYPSKIFMGDTGSTFLGAVWAFLLLQSESINELITLLLISTPLYFDAILCILRRIVARDNIFTAHKLHIYQRLYMAGFIKSKITLIYALSSLSIAMSYFFIGDLAEQVVSLICIAFLIFLDKQYALPFSYALEKNTNNTKY